MYTPSVLVLILVNKLFGSPSFYRVTPLDTIEYPVIVARNENRSGIRSCRIGLTVAHHLTVMPSPVPYVNFVVRIGYPAADRARNAEIEWY